MDLVVSQVASMVYLRWTASWLKVYSMAYSGNTLMAAALETSRAASVQLGVLRLFIRSVVVVGIVFNNQ